MATPPNNDSPTEVSSLLIPEALSHMTRSHPWHGLGVGKHFPNTLNAYIEIVPTDTMKFELDKLSGILKIDRPQRFSNRCPAPYGFVPRTLCSARVAAFTMERSKRTGIKGDGDPLDICVLCESDINHGDVLVAARPIGGLRLLDGNEADDKIIAVLDGDLAYGDCQDISDLPSMVVDRICHYFLTYKEIPGKASPKMELLDIYGHDDAIEVTERSRHDYEGVYGDLSVHIDTLMKFALTRLRMADDNVSRNNI